MKPHQLGCEGAWVDLDAVQSISALDIDEDPGWERVRFSYRMAFQNADFAYQWTGVPGNREKLAYHRSVYENFLAAWKGSAAQTPKGNRAP